MKLFHFFVTLSFFTLFAPSSQADPQNSSSTEASRLHGVVLPSTVTSADALKAWENFKKQGLTSENTPGPNMLRQFWNGDTRGEYQSWALIMAVMHDEHETAQQLWNFCKHYIPSQKHGLVPWLIQMDPNKASGLPAGDACFDYAIALDIAARKWPDYRDDEGKSWADWASYYIDQIYGHYRARAVNPESPNAISGVGFDRSKQAYGRGTQEHYHPHYAPYGYFRNWQDRTGNLNWTEEVEGLESVYQAEINLQKPTLAKYYGEADENLYCWPPHQVRKTGLVADDLPDSYKRSWDRYNWGPGRIAARAHHAYTNYGDPHAEKMLRFLAERYNEETGGDPEKIRKGYRTSGGGCSGWGEPDLWHVGHAAMAAMIDEKYRDMLDRMALALKEADTEGNPQWNLAQAYYLMHLTGGMDFRIGE